MASLAEAKNDFVFDLFMKALLWCRLTIHTDLRQNDAQSAHKSSNFGAPLRQA